MQIFEIQLKVNPEILSAKSDTVLSKAKSIEAKFDQIAEAVNRSGSYWKGDAAEDCRKKYKKYADDIAEAIGRFKENAKSLKQISGNYATTETKNTTEAEGLPVDIIS